MKCKADLKYPHSVHNIQGHNYFNRKQVKKGKCVPSVGLFWLNPMVDCILYTIFYVFFYYKSLKSRSQLSKHNLCKLQKVKRK